MGRRGVVVTGRAEGGGGGHPSVSVALEAGGRLGTGVSGASASVVLDVRVEEGASSAVKAARVRSSLIEMKRRGRGEMNAQSERQKA